MCEAAAVSLSLSDTSSTIAVVGVHRLKLYHIPGCYWDTFNPGSLYFNPETTAVKDCSYSSNSYKNKCICVTAPLCSEHNGAMSNNGACYCGTSSSETSATGIVTTTKSELCREVSTGLFCISSLNMCARACPLGKYRSAATNGVCIECPIGQHSDDATDNTRCKLW